MTAAVQDLAPYTGEMFVSDAVWQALSPDTLPDPFTLQPAWSGRIAQVFAEAALEVPASPPSITGGREGRHGEEMGHLLAELQYMQRSYPGALW